MNPTSDTLLPINDLPIKLPSFEGPLDLLLFLIKKNEIDIYDIPIENVTRQYLEMLRGMEKLQLEVAGEFFVMAATLMYIKSRMLLPKSEQAPQAEQVEEDSNLDPRWQLVQQLIEYQRFKDAAYSLQDMVSQRQLFLNRFVQTKAEEISERPIENTSSMELWNVFNLVLRRLSEKMLVGQITDDKVTVADRMEFILRQIDTKPVFTFSSLFEAQPYNIPTIISTFLAILELSRLKKLSIQQDEHFAEIICSKLDEETTENIPSSESQVPEEPSTEP